MGQSRQGVSVGVLVDSRGYVLIGQRTATQTHSGFYEFPGGKIEAGEDPAAALERELWEEIGIQAPTVSPLIRFDHDYPNVQVRLFVYRVSSWKGQPRARLGQTLRWSSVQKLSRFTLLEANRKVILALTLPQTVLVSPPEMLGHSPQTVGQCLRDRFQTGSFDAAMVRVSPGGVKTQWLCDVAAYCPGQTLLVNAGAVLAPLPCGYSGLHLPESVMLALEARPRVDGWVGASVHSIAAALRAKKLGLDYVLIGNVRASASHPGRPGLHWRGFERIATASGVPAFAIGGLRPADIGLARKHWAQGVAGIGGFWRLRH